LGGFAPTFLLRSKLFFEEGVEQLSMGSTAERVREIAERVALDHGLELVHSEVAGPEGKPIVRIFIDKQGGVTHGDCSEVSLHLGTILDVEDFIHSAYTLEVSSPGLERGLYKREDYERFAGHAARIKSRMAVNGQRNFRGRIVGLEGDEIAFEDRTSGLVKLPFQAITKANLEVDVQEELRARKELSTGKGRAPITIE
jgi:ribosome maturation factor RimP